jgi:hypothetical protein
VNSRLLTAPCRSDWAGPGSVIFAALLAQRQLKADIGCEPAEPTREVRIGICGHECFVKHQLQQIAQIGFAQGSETAWGRHDALLEFALAVCLSLDTAALGAFLKSRRWDH